MSTYKRTGPTRFVWGGVAVLMAAWEWAVEDKPFRASFRRHRAALVDPDDPDGHRPYTDSRGP